LLLVAAIQQRQKKKLSSRIDFENDPKNKERIDNGLLCQYDTPRLEIYTQSQLDSSLLSWRIPGQTLWQLKTAIFQDPNHYRETIRRCKTGPKSLFVALQYRSNKLLNQCKLFALCPV
jgi:hypothetical protein